MPELTSTSITKDNCQAELEAKLAGVTLDKAVMDFIVGKSSECADAKMTYGSPGGWSKLPDGSMFKEIDPIVVKKYDLCKEVRPDLVKPYTTVMTWNGVDICDSYYYHTDGDKNQKLLTRLEMLDVIAAQGVTDGDR